MIRLAISALFAIAAFAADGDRDFEQGMQLARAEKWDAAREAFLRGRATAPDQKRFSLELAGIAFRTGDRLKAIEELRRALAIDPRDDYANDAIGSLYLLEGRLDAAIPYWNRVDKPHIHNVVADGRFLRAIEVEPGEMLTEDALAQTAENFSRLGYSTFRMELTPYDPQTFDLAVHVANSSVTGSTLPGRLIEIASGLPYQTVNMSFRPGRDWLETIDTSVRWDPNKRMAKLQTSGLINGNPRFRYIFDAAGRDEDWDVRSSELAPFGFTTASAGASIDWGINSRVRWTNGFSASSVHYSAAPAGQPFRSGLELKEVSQVSYRALRIPSKRFSLTLDGDVQLGNLGSPFAKYHAAALTQWAHGDMKPWAMHASLSAGGSMGNLPFNEYYILGMGRDNDLWIRGHNAEYDGRKGNGPMGNRFFLSQFDALKTIYGNGFVQFEIGPFVDSGRVSGTYGSHGWMLDTGAEAQVRILKSTTFILVYGRDTLNGGGVIFTAIRAGG